LDLEAYVAQVNSNIAAIHEDFHSFCEGLDRDSDRKVATVTSRFEDLMRAEASAREASLADARSAAEARDARTITIIEELRADSRENAERHAALLSAQTAVLEKLSTPSQSLDLQPLIDILAKQAASQNMQFLAILDAVRTPPARPLDISSVHSEEAQAQGLSDSGDAPLQVHLGERSSRSDARRMHRYDIGFGTPNINGIAPDPGGDPNGSDDIASHRGGSPSDGSGGGSGASSIAGDDDDDPNLNFWEVDVRNFSAGQTIRPSWRARHPAYYGGSEIERQLAAPLPDLTHDDVDIVKFIVSSYNRMKQEKSDSKRVTQFTTFFPTPSEKCPLIATLTKLIKHIHQNGFYFPYPHQIFREPSTPSPVLALLREGAAAGHASWSIYEEILVRSEHDLGLYLHKGFMSKKSAYTSTEITALYPELPSIINTCTSSTGIGTLMQLLRLAGHPVLQRRHRLSVPELAPQGDNETLPEFGQRVLEHAYELYCIGRVPGAYFLIEDAFHKLRHDVRFMIGHMYSSEYGGLDRVNGTLATFPLHWHPCQLGNTFERFYQEADYGRPIQAARPSLTRGTTEAASSSRTSRTSGAGTTNAGSRNTLNRLRNIFQADSIHQLIDEADRTHEATDADDVAPTDDDIKLAISQLAYEATVVAAMNAPEVVQNPVTCFLCSKEHVVPDCPLIADLANRKPWQRRIVMTAIQKLQKPQDFR
jgi:hypothetical protein